MVSAQQKLILKSQHSPFHFLIKAIFLICLFPGIIKLYIHQGVLKEKRHVKIAYYKDNYQKWEEGKCYLFALDKYIVYIIFDKIA